MPFVNRVLLMGVAARPVVLKVVRESLSVAELGLRVTETFRDRSGKSAARETLFDVVAFGEVATELAGCVGEGAELLVQGRLRMEERGGAEGPRRTVYTVICERFQAIEAPDGARRTNSDQPAPAEPAVAPAGPGTAEPPPEPPPAPVPRRRVRKDAGTGAAVGV
jgi:single stranded DNA-binding protein